MVRLDSAYPTLTRSFRSVDGLVLERKLTPQRFRPTNLSMKGQFEDAEDQPEDGEGGGDRANGHSADANGHAPSS